MALKCESCGLPLPTSELRTRWCGHCLGPDGAAPTYERTLERLTARYLDLEGGDPDEAREIVAARLAKLPAWRNRT